MKIDVDALILDMDGKAVRWPRDQDDLSTLEDVKLSNICVNALMSETEEMVEQEPAKRIHRVELALSIHKGGEVEMTPEDVVMIRDLIHKQKQGALIMKRAYDLLDGKNGS